MKFELVLFSTDCQWIKEADAAGIDTFIVDWEARGKESRQSGFDTQINRDSLEDLKNVRACTNRTLLCRINGFGKNTRDEVEDAVKGGADEILLPMVRRVSEVVTVLKWTDNRCGLGILIETPEAVELSSELAALPLSRVYIGLNDLAICRDYPSIFTAVVDGTVEQVRSYFHLPFGFGGLTLPDKGEPIPCRLLISEMIRLQCNFSFLRRSFHRDMQNRNLQLEVPRIKEAISTASSKASPELEEDHRHLVRQIQKCRIPWKDTK